MPKFFLFLISIIFSFSVLAQDLALEGFRSRFNVVKNSKGKVIALKLNRAVTHFSIMPFLEQMKADLLNEQRNSFDSESEIDQMLYDMGLDPYAIDGSLEAKKIKEALLQVGKIDVEATWKKLMKNDFWKEFERRLNEAAMYADPRMLANLEDPTFFYKRQATYLAVKWGLKAAKEVFRQVPILNIATFVIFRVHDMMMEQRHFHQNMLLQYFHTIPETQLGMTKGEVDRSVSSIYEHRIAIYNIKESRRAARGWANYGMNKFYQQVRDGNTRIRNFEAGFRDVKRLNFSFAEVTNERARQIYHLHTNAFKFSKKPSLAYDFSRPGMVRRNRIMLNFAVIGLGFIPHVPDFIINRVQSFVKSHFVKQIRIEGALIGHFESTGNLPMIKQIFAQRTNFYILE